MTSILTGAKVDLSGRVMLVTGASSGIGAAVAREAAAAGALLVLAARRLKRLEQLASEIVAAGGEAIAVELDVADEASTIAAYDAAEQAFGVIDTVFANAGIGHRARSTDLDMETFDHVIAINLRGAFLTVREGAKRMIAAGSADHGRGRIVITSSLTATTATPGLIAYTASKAAVLHMAHCLAREWIRLGININAVLPGYIRTELNDAMFVSGPGDKMVAEFPRRRLMQIDDVVPMILFLASDAARAITGASFTLDDGQGL